MQGKRKCEVWIGLIGVTPTKDSTLLGSAPGAYVNVLGFCSHIEEFREQIKKECDHLGLILSDTEDFEPLRIRQREFEVDRELIKLAKAVEYDQKIRFGDFHTYPSSDVPRA